MVGRILIDEVHISGGTEGARVVMPRATIVYSAILDMHLAIGMHEAQQLGRQGGHGVLFVIDMADMRNGVHVGGKSCIPDLDRIV